VDDQGRITDLVASIFADSQHVDSKEGGRGFHARTAAPAAGMSLARPFCSYQDSVDQGIPYLFTRHKEARGSALVLGSQLSKLTSTTGATHDLGSMPERLSGIPETVTDHRSLVLEGVQVSFV